ncbi:signal peptidase I [Candidatus Saccharibacteria bacterium]|nr:signal peptidase I [Candidatus Saccharibacteria bacterium]
MDEGSNELKISKKTVRPRESNDSLKRKAIRLLVKICVIAGLFVVIFGFIIGLTTMSGVGMKPNIADGALLIYSRIEHSFKRGDVVVFEKDGKLVVQRVVAEGGQTVDINEDGEVLIDGNVEEETVYYETIKDEKAAIQFPYRVEDGSVFTLNDARSNLGDSRSFGGVEISKISGKVIGKIQVRNI